MKIERGIHIHLHQHIGHHRGLVTEVVRFDLVDAGGDVQDGKIAIGIRGGAQDRPFQDHVHPNERFTAAGILDHAGNFTGRSRECQLQEHGNQYRQSEYIASSHNTSLYIKVEL